MKTDTYESILNVPYVEQRYNIINVKDANELEEWLSQGIDKRKLITIDNVRHYHDMNCGAMVRDKAPNNFTLPAFKVMSKLVKNLSYANCILCSAGDMALLLDCGVKNIKRTVSVCGPLVKFADKKEVKRGFVKLFINPAYGWKAESDIAYATQQNAICDWYKENMQKQSDIVFDEFEFSEEFDKWLVGFKNGLRNKVVKPEPFDYTDGEI